MYIELIIWNWNYFEFICYASTNYSWTSNRRATYEWEQFWRFFVIALDMGLTIWKLFLLLVCTLIHCICVNAFASQYGVMYTYPFLNIHQKAPGAQDLADDNLVPMPCEGEFHLSFLFYAFVAATNYRKRWRKRKI